ncbi:hypothetical protein PoB_004340400 [Plakobranchus ocellatus]|uniref:Uncharacterized protein n=1 Tax=Plakobranchus ocellatus TaxID=259542 RepID=A0AAV4BDK8_9GAST|nr:hypothetical protein PoB_004340400 [Plakobranchus ocellatus]
MNAPNLIKQQRAVETPSFHQKLLRLLMLVLLCACALQPAQARSSTSLLCNPSEVKMTCLLGCYGCLEGFGVELYDMAACCRDCKITGMDIVDDGPARCSSKYIRKSWLKRIG